MGKNSGGVRESRPAYKKSLTSGEKIASVIDDIKRDGYSKVEPFSIGRVEQRMKDFAKENNIQIIGNSIYMRVKDISHTIRRSKKDKGISITEAELVSFPKRRFKMDVYFDSTDNSFIYVDKGMKAKYVIHTNYNVKTRDGVIVTSNYITATRMKNFEELNLPKYKKV